MDDPDARYAQHYGVVDIACHLFHGVVEPLAAYIKFGAEVQFSLIDGRVHLDGRHRTHGLLHRTLELIRSDALDLVQRHLAADVSDYHGNRLGRYLGHLADHAVLLYADLLSHLQRCCAECLEPFLLGLLLTYLLLSVLVCTLCLSLLLAFPAGIQLLDLLFYVVVLCLLFLFLSCRQDGHEVLKSLSCLLGLLLCSLRLLDGLDGVLYLSVCSTDDLLGLLLGLVEDLLLHLLDLLEFLLIFVGDVLQSLVSMLDALELLVESLAVACDLAEVPLDAHEFFSGPAFCILDDGLGKSHLAREFKGERVARQSHLEFEHRRDVLHVEHHRSVHHSCICRCVQFEVCIVGGDDSVCAALVQVAQDRFGNGASGCRLGTRTELVDEDEGLVVGLCEHLLHVLEERTVCTEVVLDGLVVSDVDHDAVEDHEFGSL